MFDEDGRHLVEAMMVNAMATLSQRFETELQQIETSMGPCPEGYRRDAYSSGSGRPKGA